MKLKADILLYTIVMAAKLFLGLAVTWTFTTFLGFDLYGNFNKKVSSALILIGPLYAGIPTFALNLFIDLEDNVSDNIAKLNGLICYLIAINLLIFIFSYVFEINLEIYWFIIAMVLTGINHVRLSYLRSINRVSLSTLPEDIFRPFITVILIIFFSRFWKEENIFFLYLYPLLFSTFLGFFLIKDYTHTKINLQLDFKFLLAYVVYLSAALLPLIDQHLDLFILGKTRFTDADIGVFKLVIQLGLISYSVSNIYAVVILPRIRAWIVQKEIKLAKRAYLKARVYGVLINVILFGLLTILLGVVVDMFSVSNIKLFRTLLVAYLLLNIAVSFFGPSISTLISMNKQNELTKSALLYAAIKLTVWSVLLQFDTSIDVFLIAQFGVYLCFRGYLGYKVRGYFKGNIV